MLTSVMHLSGWILVKITSSLTCLYAKKINASKSDKSACWHIGQSCLRLMRNRHGRKFCTHDNPNRLKLTRVSTSFGCVIVHAGADIRKRFFFTLEKDTEHWYLIGLQTKYKASTIFLILHILLPYSFIEAKHFYTQSLSSLRNSVRASVPS